ncbi:hypothetical protein EVAR_61163_1 [Eumeta japonica]|uniref:Uncharacterized protein n=1 Tax=Eumeta variegata TaxID=151549 RepID=A0A4C1ZTC7_EUMVA|nr:hypothetical protein EVAR_61163_1 [Eumeta japonica]
MDLKKTVVTLFPKLTRLKINSFSFVDSDLIRNAAGRNPIKKKTPTGRLRRSGPPSASGQTNRFPGDNARARRNGQMNFDSRTIPSSMADPPDTARKCEEHYNSVCLNMRQDLNKPRVRVRPKAHYTRYERGDVVATTKINFVERAELP